MTGDGGHEVPALIQGQQVRFRYNQRWVLDGVDLEACSGEVVALFGPNGSGKSTLLRLLAGLLQPQGGAVSLSGAPLASYSRRRLAQRVAFLPQMHPPLHHITVGELVARGRSPHRRFGWALSRHDLDRVRWALAYLRLERLEHRDVGSLSGGEQQRVWIAMVLAQDAEAVLLDEPVTFLDLKHQWDLLCMFRDLVAEYGKTVLAVFHDVNHGMAVSDRTYLLRDGRGPAGPRGDRTGIGLGVAYGRGPSGTRGSDPHVSGTCSGLTPDVHRGPSRTRRHARRPRP